MVRIQLPYCVVQQVTHRPVLGGTRHVSGSTGAPASLPLSLSIIFLFFSSTPPAPTRSSADSGSVYYSNGLSKPYTQFAPSLLLLLHSRNPTATRLTGHDHCVSVWQCASESVGEVGSWVVCGERVGAGGGVGRGVERRWTRRTRLTRQATRSARSPGRSETPLRVPHRSQRAPLLLLLSLSSLLLAFTCPLLPSHPLFPVPQTTWPCPALLLLLLLLPLLLLLDDSRRV